MVCKNWDGLRDVGLQALGLQTKFAPANTVINHGIAGAEAVAKCD